MNHQDFFADHAMPLTLKEAVRLRTSSPVKPVHYHSEPRLIPWAHVTGQISPSVKPESCHRRKLPCFLPRREIYVFHRNFGQVTSIGMGGFSFTYREDRHHEDELPQEGLLMASNRQYIDALPFETTADLVLIPSFAGRYQIRKRSIRFGKLGDEQVEELERFILNNALIPQLSQGKRRKPEPMT